MASPSENWAWLPRICPLPAWGHSPSTNLWNHTDVTWSILSCKNCAPEWAVDRSPHLICYDLPAKLKHDRQTLHPRPSPPWLLTQLMPWESRLSSLDFALCSLKSDFYQTQNGPVEKILPKISAMAAKRINMRTIQLCHGVHNNYLKRRIVRENESEVLYTAGHVCLMPRYTSHLDSHSVKSNIPHQENSLPGTKQEFTNAMGHYIPWGAGRLALVLTCNFLAALQCECHCGAAQHRVN